VEPRGIAFRTCGPPSPFLAATSGSAIRQRGLVPRERTLRPTLPRAPASLRREIGNQRVSFEEGPARARLFEELSCLCSRITRLTYRMAGKVVEFCAC
jgi:hypothetical protein